MKSIITFLTIIILAMPTLLFAQTEMLDSTFNGNGKVTTDIGTNTDLIFSIAIQSDGKIVAVGSAIVAGVTKFAVLRYNANGSLDNTFGTGGIVTTGMGGFDAASAIVIQSDGKIVVGGSTYSTTLDFAAIRYNTNGTLDVTYDGDGIAIVPVGSANDVVSSMLLQPDGKIVLAGRAEISSVTHFALARLNTNGSLDNTFDTDGKLTTVMGTNAGSDIMAIALQSDGKIVATGDYMPASNTDGVPLARYNTDGSLDNTFGTGGKTITHAVTFFTKGMGMVIQSDGKMLVISEGTPLGADYDFVLLRYNTDGTPDNTFGTGGKITTNLYAADDRPGAIILQPDGKIIVGGFSWSGTSFPDFSVARYLSNGSLDNSFGTAGRIWTDFGTGTNTIRALALQADGKIVAGGGMNSGTATSDFALARYVPGVATEVINLSSPAGSVIIYPNPSSGKFQFTIDHVAITKNYQVEITNVMGEKVNHLQNTNEIDLSDASKGIYFVKITDGAKRYDQKIVVQ